MGVACIECLPGRYRSATLNLGLTCSMCPSGWFQSGFGSGSCLPCVPGEYQEFEGSPTCTSCALGTFARFINSTVCKIPNSGFVAGPSGAGSLKVADGWVSSDCVRTVVHGENNTICRKTKPCPMGQFARENACVDCPIGKREKNS